MMEDIAILTGGKCITEDLGIKLESIGLEDLGRAKSIVVDGKTRPWWPVAASPVKSRAVSTKSTSDRGNNLGLRQEKLQERLAKLAGAWPSSMSAARPRRR